MQVKISAWTSVIKTYSNMLYCVYYKKNNAFIVDSTDAYWIGQTENC